jgi:hypothetical protein
MIKVIGYWSTFLFISFEVLIVFCGMSWSHLTIASLINDLKPLAILTCILGFFLFKVIVITDDSLTIISILNPFRFKTKIPYSQIKGINLHPNYFMGVYHVTIEWNDNKREYSFLLLWFDQKLIRKLLREKIDEKKISRQ